MVHCLVVGCHNTKDVSYHILPEDEQLRKMWLAKIKRDGKLPKPENCHVCSDHFNPEDFKRDLQVCNISYFFWFHRENQCFVFHIIDIN